MVIEPVKGLVAESSATGWRLVHKPSRLLVVDHEFSTSGEAREFAWALGRFTDAWWAPSQYLQKQAGLASRVLELLEEVTNDSNSVSSESSDEYSDNHRENAVSW